MVLRGGGGGLFPLVSPPAPPGAVPLVVAPPPGAPFPLSRFTVGTNGLWDLPVGLLTFHPLAPATNPPPPPLCSFCCSCCCCCCWVGVGDGLLVEPKGGVGGEGEGGLPWRGRNSEGGVPSPEKPTEAGRLVGVVVGVVAAVGEGLLAGGGLEDAGIGMGAVVTERGDSLDPKEGVRARLVLCSTLIPSPEPLKLELSLGADVEATFESEGERKRFVSTVIDDKDTGGEGCWGELLVGDWKKDETLSNELERVNLSGVAETAGWMDGGGGGVNALNLRPTT